MKLAIIITALILNYNNCKNCELLEQIFKSKELLHFLHIENSSRRILYLEENKYCNLNKLILEDLMVKSVPASEINKYKNKIFVEKISFITDDEYTLQIFYPREGACFNVYIKDGKLNTINTVEIKSKPRNKDKINN